MRPVADRLKLLLNRGENAVLDIAESICAATQTKAFAKIRIADVANIVGSGIPGDLYRYALAAHFDVLVAKEDKAFIAIEFDGTGHDARNDLKKAAICNHFAIPMVRVKEAPRSEAFRRLEARGAANIKTLLEIHPQA